MKKAVLRVYYLRWQRLLTAAMLLAVGIAAALVCSPPSAAVAAATRQLPIYSVECTGRRCAISFDAAWGNEDTQILIDILARYNVKTTFFAVGDWAEKYPESVKALHDAGHEVMSHSNHHDHYNSFSASQIVDDLATANLRIASVTNVMPTLIRCPYGEYDDHVIAAIRSQGMEPIQWDVDSLDWKGYDAATICDRVTSRVQPGSIVLFHNAADHTPEALPQILECLIRDGYTVVPVSELILTEDYIIDHTGRQFAAEGE